MRSVKVRNSGLNPFLINPIKAVVSNKDVGVSHVVVTDAGIMCIIEIDGKSSQAMLEDIEFLNKHEFDRFKTMLQGYVKSNRVSNEDCLKYGFSLN